MINIEFILLLRDYFKTLNKRNFILEWFIPFFVGLGVFLINRKNIKIDDQLKNLSTNITSLLGVLIGFSIAVITLLVTTNSKNIEEIKTKLTSYFVGNKNLTLFDLLLINYTYSVVVEVFLTIFNLIIPSMIEFDKSSCMLNIINSLNIFLVSHILLLTVRNTTSFYFILLKKQD